MLAAAEMAVGSVANRLRNADHARATADEAGCGPRQGTDRLAPDRHHRRPGLSQLALRAQPNQAAPDPATRRALSASAPISPKATPRLPGTTSSLSPSKKPSKPQRGPRHPTDLPSRGTSIEVYIFIAFLAYCSYITLQRRSHALAAVSARSAIEKFAAVQMTTSMCRPLTDAS